MNDKNQTHTHLRTELSNLSAAFTVTAYVLVLFILMLHIEAVKDNNTT